MKVKACVAAFLAMMMSVCATAQQLPPGSVLGNFDATTSPPYPVPTTGTGPVVRTTNPVMGPITVSDVTHTGSLIRFNAAGVLSTAASYLAIGGNTDTYVRAGSGTVFIADDRGQVSIGSASGAAITVNGPANFENTLSVQSERNGCAQLSAIGTLRSTGSNCTPDIGGGLSYVVSGLTITLPTSGIQSLYFYDKGANGGATCSNPTVNFVGGDQSIGSSSLVVNPTGGATAIPIVTGTAPNQTITGFTVTNPGKYSWPPAVRISGCTGFYKVDGVLDQTAMLTVSITAGVLKVGSTLYNVPAYTYTYLWNPSAGATCDYFNISTLQWLHDQTCSAGPPNNILMHFVSTGSQDSWPRGAGGNPPKQVWQITQIPGVVPFANRVWSVLQQGVGQATQGNDYACTIGIVPGTGSCSFNGRWYSYGSDDPTNMPYSPNLDGNNVTLHRVAKGRQPLSGDFGWTLMWAAQSLGSGNGVGINVMQMFGGTADPTDGLMRGSWNLAVAAPETGGGSINAWSAWPGLVSWNYIDGPSPQMGADTISLHSRTNFDGNPGGIYIDGVHMNLTTMLSRIEELERRLP